METRLHGGRRPDQHRELVHLEGLLGPDHVDVDHRPEVRVGACVVDQDVDPAEAGHRLGHTRLGVFGVPDVAGYPGHALLRDTLCDQARGRRGQILGRTRADHDVRPGLEEAGGDAQADAAAAARDQRRLVLEVELHGLSLARAAPGTSLAERRPSIAGVNHLADETSPYLRQHADNPVEWYPWGEEALTRAQEEDKPIFLSIGYASCHWCHVMAHESFEDPATAADLSKWFVSVKVDREERPDLDAVYMSATQALTGSGGWPMSVFCTPDGRPFYAGTYFPPEERHGMPSFRRVVEALGEAWVNDRTQVVQQADALADAVRKEMRLAESLREEGAGTALQVPESQTPVDPDRLQDRRRRGIGRGVRPAMGRFRPRPEVPASDSGRALPPSLAPKRQRCRGR